MKGERNINMKLKNVIQWQRTEQKKKVIEKNYWNSPYKFNKTEINTYLSIINCSVQFSSVQFTRSVVSDYLRPHESQHVKPPCPSPTPRVHSDSGPSSQWCHPAISSSVVPFFSCPPIPPSIKVFSNESTRCMRWPKYWSFSFSIIPSKEIPGLIPSEWIDWISLQSKGLSRVFSNTTVQKHQFFGTQLSSQSNSHIHTWPLEKP